MNYLKFIITVKYAPKMYHVAMGVQAISWDIVNLTQSLTKNQGKKITRTKLHRFFCLYKKLSPRYSYTKNWNQIYRVLGCTWSSDIIRWSGFLGKHDLAISSADHLSGSAKECFTLKLLKVLFVCKNNKVLYFKSSYWFNLQQSLIDEFKW